MRRLLVLRQPGAATRGAAPGGSRRFMVASAATVHKGARADRLTGAWATEPMSADDLVRRNQRALVARSRVLVQSDYGKAFLRMVRQNVVGSRGVKLAGKATDGGRLDTIGNVAVETAWWRWGRRENCTVTGRMSWRSVERACIEAAARDGEFMLRIVTGPDAGPWGFAVQLIDPQRCPVHLEAQLPGGRFIRHGIEFNQFGRPLAYLFAAEPTTPSLFYVGDRGYQRIPADEIVHGFVEDLVGQKRGLPWAATALWRLQMLDGFEEAALVNARVSAAKGGFFEWAPEQGPIADADELRDEDPLVMDVEPGTYQELPPGLTFKPNSPAFPAGELQGWQKGMLRGAAAGLGVSYNSFAQDLEGVSFSSIRQGTLDERESWKDMQEWFIEALHEVVFARWLAYSLLAGRIVLPSGRPLPADKLDKFAVVEWQARRWSWIDPKSEVEAALLSRGGLLTSTGTLIREQGGDPEEVYAAIAEDIAAQRAAGIPDELILSQYIKPGAAPVKPQGSEGQDGKGKG